MVHETVRQHACLMPVLQLGCFCDRYLTNAAFDLVVVTQWEKFAKLEMKCIESLEICTKNRVQCKQIQLLSTDSDLLHTGCLWLLLDL